ncbi:uncharacterized protein LOC112341881 [Selaginella moellendorffii]|uniref:uncharacterized protein LOC112341881 n=1 Tax=Selaginella moellendorffii TaxID=88036 RepID=UPI000D1CFFCE|nr:uncharacterized protein LOC112341881 [Selaginella moellendorffii]|eukprot:XP_024518592.1 uncharacterized protein LOC112341881 [Selaginella moellendorffii]
MQEETALQGGKRLVVEERKGELRRIQRQILALKLGLGKMELHTALAQEELRSRQAKADKLVQERRELALEICQLQQQQAQGERIKCDEQQQLESVQELRQTASELEMVLKRLDSAVEAATRSEEYLAGVKCEVQDQVRENEWIKRRAEEQVGVARDWMRAMHQLQHEVKALQLENQSLERELLAALQE